jgi:hypothetical protein
MGEYRCTERRCYVNDGRDGCAWCGRVPARLFAYGSLAATPPGGRRLFCAVDCCESFHDVELARPIVAVQR